MWDLLKIYFLNFYWSIVTFSASLVSQLEKNFPAMQESPVQFLGQEDQLQKG